MNLYSDSTQLDSSYSAGKNRVRSMVNQLNAAVSSTRPTAPSSMTGIRTIAPISSRRIEPTTNSIISNGKTTITSPNRPSLQRAMTINNNSPVTPSPPSTPPTPNNNIPSTYKRK